MNCNCSALLLLVSMIMMLIFEQEMQTNAKQLANQDSAAPRQKHGLVKRSDVSGASKALSRLILGNQEMVVYRQAVRSCQDHGASLIARSTAISIRVNISNLIPNLSNHTQIWLKKERIKKLLDIKSGNVSTKSPRGRHWAVCLKKTLDVLKLCNRQNVTRTTYANINEEKDISFCAVGDVELDEQANVNGTQLGWWDTDNGFSIAYRMVTDRKYIITVSIDKIGREHGGLLNVTIYSRGGLYSLSDAVLVKVRETTHADTDIDPPVRYIYLSKESMSVPVVCVLVSLAIATASMTTYLLIWRCLLKDSSESVRRENDKSGEPPQNNLIHSQINVGSNKDSEDLYSVIQPYETIKDIGVVRKESILTDDELKSLSSPIISWLRATTLETIQEPVYAVVDKSKSRQIVAAMNDSVLTGTTTLLSEDTDHASFDYNPKHQITF